MACQEEVEDDEQERINFLFFSFLLFCFLISPFFSISCLHCVNCNISNAYTHHSVTTTDIILKKALFCFVAFEIQRDKEEDQEGKRVKDTVVEVFIYYGSFVEHSAAE